MYSVDLAAHQFLTGLGLEPTLFQAQYKRRPFAIHRIKHEIYHSTAQLDDFPVVLFWGDFINNPTYGANDFAHREAYWGREKSLEKSYEKWKNLFLLNGYNRHQKVFSISNNFQTLNSIASQFDAGELDSVKALYAKNFDHFFPRDTLSTALLKKFIPDQASKITTGVDSAFLLNQKKIYPELSNIQKSGTFAHLLTRSSYKNTESFIHKISGATRLKPRPISNWLKTNRFHPDHTYKAALKTLQSSEFVITDTYHLAINAINLGIPTIGIGLYQTEQINTCADFKKRVLFEDLGIANFYIETQTNDIKDSIDQILSNRESLKNYNLSTAVSKKETYAKQLTDTLTLPK